MFRLWTIMPLLVSVSSIGMFFDMPSDTAWYGYTFVLVPIIGLITLMWFVSKEIWKEADNRLEASRKNTDTEEK